MEPVSRKDLRAGEEPRTHYEVGKEARSREMASFDGQSRIIGLLRLAVVGGALALVGGIVWASLPENTWIAVGALGVLFLILVIVHARVDKKRDLAGAAVEFNVRGLARLDGKWQERGSTGDAFATPNHPYAGDLDLFGKASLFRLLDWTETRFGAGYLAGWLKGAVGKFPDSVRERQEAVRDLAPRFAFRERLSAVGALTSEDKPDPEPFLQWAEGKVPLDAGLPLVLAARILPIFSVGAIAFAKYLPSGVWIAFVLLQLVVTAPKRAAVAQVTAAVSSKEGGFSRFSEMLLAIEEEAFEAPLLTDRKSRIVAGKGGPSATGEMDRLARILSFIDARENALFRLIMGPVLLWDLNCAIQLEKWRLRVGPRARGWLEALGEIEALSSLAALAHDQPDYAWPELRAEPYFAAEGLGHPLIAPARRVDNDVSLGGPGHALIVTGSNMSGKSTLLRAMGVNAVLALAGAPICAKRLEIGSVRVCTSMRVRDSLEEGVSHFYAELQRLKMVLDMAKGEKPVLFLLDEILHGTNTRERLIGARAIVRALVARRAMGAVSTHDLGISDLQEELPDAVRNVHLQEQVDGDKMTFDYKLRDGVVQSSNALLLMKMVGLEVV
jgi:hypothetical protein